MTKKIQDKGFKYCFVKLIVDWGVRRSFRRYQIEGRENLDFNSSMIWASNHTNALMDPLVLLASASFLQPVVFMARADVFKKKLAVKLLTFLKIMPIYRIRDGLDAVKKNGEIIEHSVGVINDRVPLSLFPETTHRTKHSLLPLSKGVFHIAIEAVNSSNGEKPVCIVPIGIDYSDYFRFRPNMLLRFGEPINVTEFLKQHEDLTQPQQMQLLRERLQSDMSKLIAFVPDTEEEYDAVWEYAKLKSNNSAYFKNAIAEIERENGPVKGLLRKQAVTRHAIDEIMNLKRANPAEAERVLHGVERRRLWRIQHGVSVYSLASDTPWRDFFVKFFLLLLGLPLYVFSMTVSIPIWVTAIVFLRSVKDDAFYNTVRFSVRFALGLLTFIFWAIIFLKFLPGLLAWAAILLVYPSYAYMTDYRELSRRCFSNLNWLSRRKKTQKMWAENGLL